MLYRFKSKACADVVMLEWPGKQWLEAMGKDTQGPGILLVEHMGDALRRMHEAVEADNALRAAFAAARHAQKVASENNQPVPSLDGVPQPVDNVPLHARFKPMVDMIEHSMNEDCPITWGV